MWMEVFNVWECWVKSVSTPFNVLTLWSLFLNVITGQIQHELLNLRTTKEWLSLPPPHCSKSPHPHYALVSTYLTILMILLPADFQKSRNRNSWRHGKEKQHNSHICTAYTLYALCTNFATVSFLQCILLCKFNVVLVKRNGFYRKIGLEVCGKKIHGEMSAWKSLKEIYLFIPQFKADQKKEEYNCMLGT